MRGKPNWCGIKDDEARITPADAGKTAVPILQIYIVQDHPRGCGENYVHGNIVWDL